MYIVIYWNTIGCAGSTKLSKENIPCNIRQLVHGTRHQSSYPSFLETRTVLDKERSGRQKISEENVDRLRQSFALSHSKSICPDARQLKLQSWTVHKVLHKKLRLYSYKAPLLQRFEPTDKPRRKEFTVNMVEWMFEDVPSWCDSCNYW